MEKDSSLLLGDYFENFIGEKISEGRYHDASEVIRAALRLLEEEEHRVSILKNALEEGLNSGLATGFDPEKHLTMLKAQRK